MRLVHHHPFHWQKLIDKSMQNGVFNTITNSVGPPTRDIMQVVEHKHCLGCIKSLEYRCNKYCNLIGHIEASN